MTSKEIIKALKEYYKDTRQWAFFEELRVGTGYREWDRHEQKYKADNPEQRIDAWVVNCYKSQGFKKIAFEIKVSRSDFLYEIANPQKRFQALTLSNYFYFAAPKGLIKRDEIPEECGLVEINEKGKISWTKKAPRRETEGPTWGFLAALARRSVNKMERKEGKEGMT